MEIFISVANSRYDLPEPPNSIENVLRRMARTIKAMRVPGASTYSDGSIYGSGSTSCYARVAKHLVHNWDDTWVIYMFANMGNFESVQHCCLYSRALKPILDSFPNHQGRIVVDNGAPVYRTTSEDYPLLRSLTLHQFKERYLDVLK